MFFFNDSVGHDHGGVDSRSWRAPAGSGSHTVAVDLGESHGPLLEDPTSLRTVPGYLSISVTSRFANRAWLTSLLTWATQHTNATLIVEGSYLERWNLLADGTAPDLTTATQLVRPAVQRMARRVSSVLEELKIQSRIVHLNWEAELRTPGYIEAETAIAEFHASDSAFQDAIEQTLLAHAAATRKPIRSSSILSTSYLLEELAMFLHLYRQGFLIEIYPGSDLDIMERLARGDFSGFPLACPSRTHISLTPIGWPRPRDT